MLEKNAIVAANPITDQQSHSLPELTPARFGGLLACLLGFIACLLVAIAPLERLGGSSLLDQIAPGMTLTTIGSWLPRDLGLPISLQFSFLTAQNLEFHSLVIILFALYALGGYLIWRQARQLKDGGLLRLIGLITLLAGLIFVVTPAMLSHDIYVYAGYGRVLTAHQANPYFTTLSTFPQDPLNIYDDWSDALAAYGPIWLFVCAGVSLLLGANLVGYVLVYRLLALTFHLLNTFLIVKILRAHGRSPRTVVLGAFLYALNPLILLESSLGGHNDVFMMTFVLLGIWLCRRGEQNDLTQPRRYLPALIALTLSALVKFTMLPILGFFAFLILCLILRQQSQEVDFAARLKANWRSILALLLTVGGVGLALTLLTYGPFWIGHSPREIIESFASPPSAVRGQFSVLRAIQEWLYYNRTPDGTLSYTLLQVFGQRGIWNDINVALIVASMLLGAYWLWRTPTTRTLVLASLTTLSALLIATPWFFPWYLTWLLGLAVCYLPRRDESRGKTLLAFVLVFTVSAFMVYVAQGYRPLGGWYGLMCLTTITPPLLTLGFFGLRFWWQRTRNVAIIKTI